MGVLTRACGLDKEGFAEHTKRSPAKGLKHGLGKARDLKKVASMYCISEKIVIVSVVTIGYFLKFVVSLVLQILRTDVQNSCTSCILNVYRRVHLAFLWSKNNIENLLKTKIRHLELLSSTNFGTEK